MKLNTDQDPTPAGRTHAGWQATRREFLAVGCLSLAGLSATLPRAAFAESEPVVRFGLVTDPHYADAPARGTRFYRESLDKMTECVELMKAEKVDFVVELGDFKDQDTPPEETKTLAYLRAIEKRFRVFGGPTYHVLGNHDVDSISKKQFQEAVTNTGIPKDRSYYSFDKNGIHFIVLDANYNSDGTDYDHGKFDWTDANVSPDELAWLKDDLKSSTGPVIGFIHQLLDSTPEKNKSYYVNNAAAVRKLLSASGRALAVFQGHHHSGGHTPLDGVHYYTLKAMVEGSGPESSAYAIVEVDGAGGVLVNGYRRAETSRL